MAQICPSSDSLHSKLKKFLFRLHQLYIVWEHLSFCCLILLATVFYFCLLSNSESKFLDDSVCVFSSLPLPQCLAQIGPLWIFLVDRLIHVSSIVLRKNRLNIWVHNCATFWDVTLFLLSRKISFSFFNLKLLVIDVKSNNQATVC